MHGIPDLITIIQSKRLTESLSKIKNHITLNSIVGVKNSMIRMCYSQEKLNIQLLHIQ